MLYCQTESLWIIQYYVKRYMLKMCENFKINEEIDKQTDRQKDIIDIQIEPV